MKRETEYFKDDNIKPDFTQLNEIGCYKLLQETLKECFRPLSKMLGEDYDDYIKRMEKVAKYRIEWIMSKTCKILVDVMEYDHSKILEKGMLFNNKMVQNARRLKLEHSLK